MEFQNGYFEGLLRSAPVRAVVDEATERVAAKARSAAPEDGGDYKNKITTGGKMQERYVGVVTANARHSMKVEARTGNLARAVRSSGRGR
ncbi:MULTISPECIES: HK97 gp10 family phage protein [unclassified Leucobacter]|uniref:HK97 gp10 family phage protein n=1 Tax=unclassified Leucobacter TaxID=2621730 RepID=UPI00301A4CD7